jgi:hypothetical protein
LREAIERAWKENFSVYGARKIRRQLRREGLEVALRGGAADAGRTSGVQSAFFGERSGFGFLVLFPGSTEFGIEGAFLTRISDRIAVVCRERN